MGDGLLLDLNADPADEDEEDLFSVFSENECDDVGASYLPAIDVQQQSQGSMAQGNSLQHRPFTTAGDAIALTVSTDTAVIPVESTEHIHCAEDHLETQVVSGIDTINATEEVNGNSPNVLAAVDAPNPAPSKFENVEQGRQITGLSSNREESILADGRKEEPAPSSAKSEGKELKGEPAPSTVKQGGKDELVSVQEVEMIELATNRDANVEPGLKAQPLASSSKENLEQAPNNAQASKTDVETTDQAQAMEGAADNDESLDQAMEDALTDGRALDQAMEDATDPKTVDQPLEAIITDNKTLSPAMHDAADNHLQSPAIGVVVTANLFGGSSRMADEMVQRDSKGAADDSSLFQLEMWKNTDNRDVLPGEQLAAFLQGAHQRPPS
eukprot:gene4000-4969_t